MRFGLRRIRRLWRRLLRLERPRQEPVAWRSGGAALVLLLCLLVALLFSWPWLVEPNLRPGMAAPFTARAPADATVIDSEMLEQRRNQMLPRSQIQVVDPQASTVLEEQLEQRLQAVRQTVASDQPRPDSLNLTEPERVWLRGLTPPQLIGWERSLRKAQLRMLSQGVVANLSEGQLLKAATLQLDGLSPPARSLGSRLLVDSLQGRTNLRSDSFLSQRRIEDLLSQQGLPTIQVRKNDVITRQGEPISPQAFDVLEYFDLVNHRPRPLAWLAHFIEALAACWRDAAGDAPLARQPRTPSGPAGPGDAAAGAGLQALAREPGQSPGPAGSPHPAAGAGPGHGGRPGLAGRGQHDVAPAGTGADGSPPGGGRPGGGDRGGAGGSPAQPGPAAAAGAAAAGGSRSAAVAGAAGLQPRRHRGGPWASQRR